MVQRKMSKSEALQWAKSLPDDDETDTVHVVRVKKSDPNWAWLFGTTQSSDADDDTDDDPDDDADDGKKPEPGPKSRNKFFGGQ